MRRDPVVRWLLIAAFAGGATHAGAAPGDLDPSFGVGGKATIPGGGNTDAASGLLQPDGKLVLAGRVTRGGPAQFDFGVARFTAAGAPDASFGSGGVAAVDFGGREFAVAVARQSDGKLVVAGFGIPPCCATSTPSVLALARLEPDGTLDPTFGTGGRVTTPMGISNAASGVAVQSDGKIVVTGFLTLALGPGGGRGLVLRYDADGTLDPSFGSGGSVAVLSTGFGEVLVQPDGGIVTVAPAPSGWSVIRFDTAGALDPSFGVGGVATIPFATFASGPAAIVRQPDGALVVGGTPVAPGGSNAFAIARLDASGALDATFGTGGVAMTDVTAGNDFLGALSLEPGGRLVVAGWTDSASAFVVTRYDAGGTLDPTFGSGGTVFTSFGTGNVAAAAGVLPDGRIVAGGYSNFVDFVAARYVVSTCGNASIEPGEECDDGSECCSPACAFEPAGTACGDDGRRCTADRCDGAGACVHPANVKPFCRQVAEPLAAKLDVRDRAVPTGDRLAWKWLRGNATSRPDFGDPRTTTDYTLCLFDGALPTPTVLLERTAPAGGTCNGRPCWTLAGDSYKYRSPSRTPDGIESIRLVPGALGKAKIVLKGRGALLGLSALPFPLPLRVQLESSDGLCWGASYDGTGTSANGTAAFRGRGQ